MSRKPTDLAKGAELHARLRVVDYRVGSGVSMDVLCRERSGQLAGREQAAFKGHSAIVKREVSSSCMHL